MNGNNALESIATGDYKIFYPENNGREGLFINIQAFLLKTFGVNEPWVLRSASAVFGVLTALGVYFLVLEILRNKSEIQATSYKLQATILAFVSSFFIAISFWHINFSRIGFRAIMASAFLAWSLYFVIKALKLLTTKYQLLLSALAGLVYGAGMHSYIAYRATPLLIIFVYLIYWWVNKTQISFKKIFINFVVFVVFALIAFAPLGAYFLENPQDFMGRTSQVSVFASDSPILNLAKNTLGTLAMFNFRGDGNWRHNYSGSPQLFWLVGIFFVLGIIIGIISLFRNSRLKNDYNTSESETNALPFTLYSLPYLFAISLFWLLVAFLPVVISNEGIPHALRAILMIPPVYIISALGFYFVYNFSLKHVSKKIIYPVIGLLFVGMIIQSYLFYFIAWGKNPNLQYAFSTRYTEIGRQIRDISPAIKKYVVVNTGGVDVRGIPMPSQTVMFITDTFTPEKQKEKNVYYILSEQEKDITDPNAVIFYLEDKISL